eukprot:TRINITY_DN1588_c1_g4_i1.p2 TRINITY_DN1588_c1_g4~~TRINITY_DN1588_c1_g4_i1.p2  ORF type:complete len:346 (+),score=108.72 TRINITY_DN1588_c1_g4_i1:69-1040(+)
MPCDLSAVLRGYSADADPGLCKVLSAIADSCEAIGSYLRVASGSAKHGAQNAFGDEQLEVDVATDKAVFDRLRACGSCSIAASEETPVETDLGGSGYSVAFDPLDGSSIVDANWSVGSIFGVWPGRGFLGRRCREQVAAVVAVYGPRVTLAVALAGAAGGGAAFELTLRRPGEWRVTQPRFKVAPAGKIFAPGNLRATDDHPGYRQLVQHWIAGRYTLRYTGGMVPDVYHILIKGKGIFTNVPSNAAKAKLRLIYEVAPIALLIECAGGESCTAPSVDGKLFAAPSSILDVTVGGLDQRLGTCYGGTAEVATYKRFVYPSARL